MNKERLTELVRILRNPIEVPGVIGFDMDEWGEETDLFRMEIGVHRIDKSKECGTVCCALGLAGLHKPFQDQGLRYDVKIREFFLNGEQQDWASDAACIFFDIPFYDGNRIFYPSHDLYGSYRPTPDKVADVIEGYIETGELRWDDCDDDYGDEF